MGEEEDGELPPGVRLDGLAVDMLASLFFLVFHRVRRLGENRPEKRDIRGYRSDL